jgi:aminoglycoside phosphotransferase (APT) family kinase protein
MHAVDVERAGGIHDLVLRRWARSDIRPDRHVVENEAAALTLLGDAALPTPRLVAADPQPTECDAPALLMTRLAGHGDLAPRDVDPWLDDLATALRAIHAAQVPEPGELFMEYTPWNVDVDVPPWSARPDHWRRAREIVAAGVPSYTPMLCHRDFHPGNVLWRRGRISGVVDWTHACRGPAAIDVARCRVNLTVLFGLDVADEFARRYGNVDDLPWFDVADVLGMGSGRPDASRWIDAGRIDIDTARLIDRMDESSSTPRDASTAKPYVHVLRCLTGAFVRRSAMHEASHV